MESPKERKARERKEAFAQVYESVCAKLQGGVSRRQILDLLASYGLVLTYSQFHELLANEASHRGEPVPGTDSEVPGALGQRDASLLTQAERTPQSDVREVK